MDHSSTGQPAGSLPYTDTNTNAEAGALRAVTRWLRCPHCATGPLRATGETLRCPSRHSFDVARQGYVSLLAGDRRRDGDGPHMVTAREHFLSSDHYRALRSTIVAMVAEHAGPEPQLVVDLAGGTGHYLAAVLDTHPAAWGLTIDLSPAALRRAARSHRRAAAVAADVEQPLPLATGSAGVVLSVFGPRPPGEIARLLAPGGVLVIASALSEHLHELRDRLGTIAVHPDKRARLERTFGEFTRLAEQPPGRSPRHSASPSPSRSTSCGCHRDPCPAASIDAAHPVAVVSTRPESFGWPGQWTRVMSVVRPWSSRVMRTAPRASGPSARR